MPYYSNKTKLQMLEEQIETQRKEMVALRAELRTVRAERDDLKEQYAARWSELTTLHRIFDKLLRRLEKYEGVDNVNTSEPNNKMPEIARPPVTA